MINDFSDLVLLIDSREREQSRINSMRDFFESRGACSSVEAITIKDGGQITSMDYAIEGSYKGKDIKLGISAKSLVDFSATIGNLSNELARGFLRFDDIGFVLVTGCYTTTLNNDELHAVIKNPGASAKNQDDRADILNTTSMFNALSSWERSGIHCRQVLYEEAFPQAVMSILTFIAKDKHEGIGFNTKGVSDPIVKNKMNFVNAHVHLGVPGLGVQTALKLYKYMESRNNPANLHYVSSISEEELQDAIGFKTGKALYEVYRCMAGWPFKVDEDSQGCAQTKDKGKSKVDVSKPLYSGDTAFLNDNKPVFKEIEPNKVDVSTLKSSKHQSSESHTEQSSSSEKQDLKVDDTLEGDSSSDLQSLDMNKPLPDSAVDSEGKPSWGCAHVRDTLQSQCDPAESEGFSKIKLTHICESPPSPADDNYKLQSQSTEQHGSDPQYSSHSALLLKISKLGTPDTFQSLSDGHVGGDEGVKSVTHDISSPYRNLDMKAGTLIQTKDERKINSGLSVQTPMSTDNTPQGDDLQSSDVHTPIHDTAGESILVPLQLPKPAVSPNHKETVNSLEDAIVDRVWNKPESDEVLMREFTSKGYKMVEVHKAIKESTKLHKYHQGGVVMVSYIGAKEKSDMDIGV